ncbi:SRPBCC family protein [Gemmatimonadota bacterium]
MKVVNRHSRSFSAPPEVVGQLLDTLATGEDALWPVERWPAMRFDRPMAVGAEGGHGPIRYTVEVHEPGRRVVFRFTGPKGFHGTHWFAMDAHGPSTELHHTIEMRVTGRARLTWPAVFRPLHDALLEDALDKAEAGLAGEVWHPRPLGWWVRALRRVLASPSQR